MKRSLAVLPFTALLLMTGPGAFAQKFDWNVNFQYIFDNSEFDYCNNVFGHSETINLVRLTPQAGVRLGNDSTVIHKIRAGVQLRYDMGCQTYRNLVESVPIYYSFTARMRRGEFGAAAGVFPRSSQSEGEYSPTIYENKYLLRNDSFQGVLFKWRSQRLFAELGCDWMGMYGDENHPDRRERFQIMSAGNWRFAGPFHLGWSGSFYHCACSPQYDNVMENHQIIPYLSWEPQCWFQEASVSLGGVFTYQRDRGAGKGHQCPMGLISKQQISKWNVGIQNTFYWGDDLMPLYEGSYKGSPQYADLLYFGEGCFHTRLDRPSAVDLLRIYYSPSINDYLHIRVAVILHLGEASASTPVFRGWVQHASLIFDLDRLLERIHKR